MEKLKHSLGYEALNELEGIRRFLAGEQVRTSSSIADTVIYGYGNLDENGFWEFPVPAQLARMLRKLQAAEEMARVCHAIKDRADLNMDLMLGRPRPLYNDLVAVLVAWEKAGKGKR